MAVLGHETLKEFLQHPEVAKNARHFTELREGRIPTGRPLLTFATVRGMTTADGDDHRRLRGVVSRASAPRGVEELRPRIEESTASLLAVRSGPRWTMSPIPAGTSHCRCPWA
jgi:cytochrome P450